MADEKVSIEVLIEASKSAKSLKDLKKSVKALNKELDNVEDGSDEFISLSDAIEEADESMRDFVVTAENAELTLGELELKQEALLESLKGTSRGTEEFEKLRLALVDVNSEIGNAELSLVGLNREDVAGAVGQLTGAVGTLTGAFVLLGGEGNETIEEIGQNIQTAIGITQAFQGAVEGVSALRKLWQNYANTLKKIPILQKAMTVAQKAFNFVVKQNPIVILVTAILALVSAIALFAAGQNKAQQESKKLAQQIEAEESAYANLVAQLDELNDARQTELDNNAKLIQSEIDLIKSKGKLTEADKERIAELEADANSVNLAKFDSTISTAQDKFGGLGNTISSQFELIKKQIDATDYEDGINDINYGNLISANSTLASSFSDLQSEGFSAENVDDQIAQINKLRTAQTEFVNVLKSQATELGSAEKELFDESIASAESLITNLGNLSKNAQDYKKALGAKTTEEQLIADREEIKKNAEEAKKAEKAEAERQKRAEAYRKRREQEAQAEKQRIIDAEKLKEEVFQRELATTEAVTLRKLELEFKANVERAKKLIKDEETLKDLLLRIEENYRTELDKINQDILDKNEEEIKAEKEKVQNLININQQASAQISVIEQEQALLDAELIKDEVERAKEKSRIIAELEKAQIKQIQVARDIELQNADLTAEQRIEIEKNTALEISRIKDEARIRDQEADQEALDKRKELNEQLVEAGFEVVQMLADASFELLAQARERDLQSELEALATKSKAQDEQLRRQVKLGLKTQRQADREKAKADKKRAKEEEKIKREAFEKDKKAKTAQAIINGALSILQVFATTPPPASYILAAVQAVATGIQIATIQSQKFARGGILNGPSHSEGGIKTPFGEMEGGEAVINKNSTQLFKKELSVINEAGGGVKFASGGVIPTQTQQIESGDGLSGTLDRLNQTLNSPLRSYVVENDITKAQNKTEQLERNASL